MPPVSPTLRDGIRVGMPFGVAAFLGGVSFGVVAEPVIGALAAIVMSAIVFAGASQFGATAVLASGGDPVTAIAAGVMLNARYLPMGVAAAAAFPGGALARGLQGQAIVDASWAAAHEGGGRFNRNILLGATVPQYPGWVAGTALGALGAGGIGDPEALGLDAIFPAFFLVLLMSEAASSRRGRVVALLGAAIALALTPLLPPGLPILLAALAALIGVRR